MAKNDFLKTYNLKFWLTLVLEVAVAFSIFIALSAWQTRDMLADEERVPTLTAESLSGEIIQFPDNAIRSNSLLYFFAPWCNVCHLSIENLNYVKSRHPNLKILIIALDYQAVTEIEDFLAEHDLNYPVLLGDREWANAYKINAFPSYYVVNSSGRVVSRSMGYSTALGMLARVAQVED